MPKKEEIPPDYDWYDDSEEKEIEWDIEDLKKSIIDSAEQSWDKYAGG